MAKANILVTGGAGYIGSHACVCLLERGYSITVVDNYSNASPVSLDRVEEITGHAVERIEGDVRDQALMEGVLSSKSYAGVMHFAGLKAVGESSQIPLNYYDHNVTGSLSLLKAMKATCVKRFIFSSSATVYGNPQYLPLDEKHPLGAVNPYGRTKQMVEDVLRDLSVAEPDWAIALLRYFNPVGAHASALIGEDPRDVPNNLMPFVAQVAVGRRPRLNVFGNDYDTPDGTGVRDFIHVVDLARGHVLALEKLMQAPGLLTINLGTGSGCSVLDMIAAFGKASGREIPYVVQERRAGDVATSYADCTRAREMLGFTAEYSIQDMCEDTWRWQANNQNGYS